MTDENNVQHNNETTPETPSYSQGDDSKETPKSLKVKADPPDISADERKRNVKKLAGAISHSLRRKGEINIRCFGNAAIGKASKALAIARNYIDVQSLQLECSPAFITTKMGNSDLTGISFCTFASNKSEEFQAIDIEQCQSVLMVKADPREVSADERKRNVKKLAGAIAHSLEENKEVVIRCFGNATIGKAAKALAIARGYTATRGPDLYCWSDFIVAEMNGNERTGIAFYAYTNEI
jgi:stage V sporulation protein SpoVS